VIEARRLVEQAAAICEETVGPMNRDTALAYDALARVELALEQREPALSHFRRALTVMEGYYLPETKPLLRLRTRVDDLAAVIGCGCELPSSNSSPCIAKPC